MTELSKGEIVATLMGRELSKRLGRAHQRISDAERRTAAEIAALRAVEDAYAQNIGDVRDSLGQLASATVDMAGVAEEQRAILGLATDGIAEIDARLRANEATDQAQDAQLGQLDIRVADVEALAPVPGPKGDKGDKGDTGPPGRSGRSSVGGGAGQATTILSGGTTVGTRGTLNFVSGATVTDDAANERVNITVAGGGGNVNSVSVSSGLSITGTSDLTITNTGVRSLAGAGVSVSAATGGVTITAASVTAGTGITVAGSGTTALTVSATGVNSVSAGTGISVSGTTALTVSATGVNSIVAGTAISVSGTTTMTVNNTGVTALAGTGISVSAATGSVTVTPTYAAPTALAIGSTVVTGAAASVANSAHVHAMPGSATAGASAVGDTAATGSATTVALSDHRHSREAFGTPGAVTGGATAASGSATTLARSDHVHSTASMPVLLASTTLGSDTASVTFSSISGAYYTLNCIYQARCTTPYGNAGEYLMVRLNGDTAGNYYSPISNTTTTTATMAEFGVINTTSNWDAQATGGNAWVYGYSNTTWFKTIATTAAPFNNSTTAFSPTNLISYYNSWRSTAVVTSLTILPLNGGNLKSGSTFRLYGYP